MDTLEDHRTEQCKSFFSKRVLNESSWCLQYLLPSPLAAASYTLWRQSRFKRLITRTKLTRFSNSFITHGLRNNQTCISVYVPLCLNVLISVFSVFLCVFCIFFCFDMFFLVILFTIVLILFLVQL